MFSDKSACFDIAIGTAWRADETILERVDAIEDTLESVAGYPCPGGGEEAKKRLRELRDAPQGELRVLMSNKPWKPMYTTVARHAS